MPKAKPLPIPPEPDLRNERERRHYPLRPNGRHLLLTVGQERFAQLVALGRMPDGKPFTQEGAYKEAHQCRDTPAVGVRASKMAHLPKVAARIAELRASILQPALDKAQITEQKLIDEWGKIAFTDLGDFMEWGPSGSKLKAIEDLTPAQRAAVAEVTQTVTKDGGTIRLRLHDKHKALEALAARYWPVPKEPEQPKAITVRVIYEDEKGKAGVEVRVE